MKATPGASNTLWGMYFGALLVAVTLAAFGGLLRGETLFRQLVDGPWPYGALSFSIGIGVGLGGICALVYERHKALRKWFSLRLLLQVRTCPLGLWLLLLFVGSVAEEIFFRGGVQGVLQESLPSAPWALALVIVGTNLVFGFLHYLLRKELFGHGIAAFFVGCVLSAVYARTGVIWVPIALHVAYNLTVTVWLWTSKTFKKG